jgi:hypothetical protein
MRCVHFLLADRLASYSYPILILLFIILVFSHVAEDQMDGPCSTNGEKRNAYRLLVGKPEGRPRPRWVDNIRMDYGEVGWGDVDWIGLAQDRNR